MSQTIHMLVADDSSTCRAIFRDCSSKMVTDVAMSEARDGLEALKLLAAARFDIAFIDLNMPGMNGVEAFAHIRQTNPKARIILTSTEPGEQVRKAMGAQPLDIFLRKPFFPQQLDDAIHAAFGLRPTYQPNSMMTASTARLSPSLA